MIVRTPICKVCNQPFPNQEMLVCERCRHYAHPKCANTFEMKMQDNTCILQQLNVDKKQFKVIFGMLNNCKESEIRKIGGFGMAEFEYLLDDMKKAGLLRRRHLIYSEPTYRAHEIAPLLEAIYSRESDVSSFMSDVLASNDKASSSRASFPISRNSAIMLLLVFVIAVFALSSAFSFMSYARMSGDLVAGLFILFAIIFVHQVYRRRRA
jgi:hypothetical protein